MKHVKALDGIRGIAVSLVFLFHFGVLPVGWIGVQVFFVLSGYLITTILLAEKHRPLTIYLSRFYWRRSLRIFPLYFVFLVIVTLVYFSSGEPGAFAHDWPFIATYTTNFGRLRESDVGPQFVHLWSLALEEQFYLIWPPLVYLLSVRSLGRVVVTILTFTPLIRLTIYFFFRESDPSWIGRNIYCLPFSQFDAFASGAAISVWRLQEAKSASRWLYVVIAITVTAGAMVLAHEHLVFKRAVKWSFGYAMYLWAAYGFVWGYTMLNALSAAVIVAALQRLPTIRFLEFWPLVRIGEISYGVYVYHLPLLFALSLLGLWEGWLFLLSAGATMLVSEISFRFLETPFLRLKDINRGMPQKIGGVLLK